MSAIFSSMAAAKTSGKLQKTKMVLESNHRVPNKQENSVKATPVRTEVYVRRAGTALSVTAPGQASGPGPVREVRVSAGYGKSLCFCKAFQAYNISAFFCSQNV